VVNAGDNFAPVSIDAALNSLKIQGIAFRGPFRTRAKRVVFVVDGYILLESELIDLLAQNKLNRKGIQEFALRIGVTKARQPPVTSARRLWTLLPRLLGEQP